MSDTRISPRRSPFPIGTKMIFYQATAPANWVIDSSKDDRYMRVVSGVGGGVAGPLSTTTTSNPNLKHRHNLNNHTHSVQSHTHAMGPSGYHKHSFGSYGTTNGMTVQAYESLINYEARDDNAVPEYTGGPDRYYRRNRSGINRVYLDTDSGTGLEGHHNHFAPDTGGPSPSTTGTTSGSFNTGGDSGNMGYTGDLIHSHTIDTAFRPAYADCIIAELVN